MQWEDIIQFENAELLTGFDLRMMLPFGSSRDVDLCVWFQVNRFLLIFIIILILYSIKDNLAISICSSCSGRHALKKRLEQVVS